MTQKATVFFALLVFASPALGGTPCATLLNGGTMSFDYTEAPPGGTNGSFFSSGVIVDVPPVEGTAAATFVLNATDYLVVVGAVDDGANFVDGGVIVIANAGPVGPGVYPLDGVTGLFVFIESAVGWMPPTDLCATNWTLELDSIVATGKHLSTSGTVTVTTVSPTVVAGTFECATEEPDTGVILAISSGSFNIDTTTSVEDSSFGKIKALYR